MDSISYISWGQLAWLIGAFVAVPVLVEGLIVTFINDHAGPRGVPVEAKGTSTQRSRRHGRPIVLGPLSFALGFLSCVAWLSWTAADHNGHPRGPGLPAPTSFPVWQIALCVCSIIVALALCLRLSDGRFLSNSAVAIGMSAGFTAAFCFDASGDITGQSAIGVVMINAALTIALFLIVIAVYLSSDRTAAPTHNS